MKKFLTLLVLILTATTVFSIENTSYCGIGARLVLDKKKVFILDTIPNSPAHLSNLPIGGEVLEINGVKVKKMPIDQVIDMVKGENGSQVNLLVKYNRKKLPYTITRKPVNIKQNIDKNFSVHWKQVVPPEYEEARYIQPHKSYSNSLLWKISTNNYWVQRRELFKTGYDACLTYPVKERNACYMNLVNREIDRTLKEKELANQQEMIRQQMYQNYQLQNMYYHNHYRYWY